jgi:multiple sugar transport system substrate-binding protein
MVTIKDVAREAGVSIATVSCALSGKKNVSHESRVKIMAAIEKLGFIPNDSARKLKLRTSRDIGVLLTSIDDLYHSEIFKGITSVIQGNNFSVNIGFSNNQPKVEIEILNDFISRNFVGIILISCITSDTAHFERLLARGIPVVFIERRPARLEVNFVGVSNRKTIAFLTEKLLRAGYKNISLFCGNPSVSSESDCADAFKSFLQKKGNAEAHSSGAIHYTNMTKEDAFRTALTAFYHNHKPDAIIATSENITHGIMESAAVLGDLLSDIRIVSFSEETWINNRYLPQTIHTSRPAFKLGASAAGLLLRNINSPKPLKNETILLDDNIIRTGIDIPPFKPRNARRGFPGRNGAAANTAGELNILTLDNSLTEALLILTRKFRNDYGITIHIDAEKQDKLPERIITGDSYDIFMFDIPWLNYFVQNGILEDITGFITADRAFFNSIIKENLSASMYGGRYYSIPYIGGGQILFYRTDLFEDPLICKDYFAMTGAKLRPPRTWREFNMVSRFFTREYNPDSPVKFGTSYPGNIAEEICPHIYNRIWGFNGNIFNRENRPEFNTANNRRAFENLIELQNYTPSPPFETSLDDTVRDFYQGKTAMLVTYTGFASTIMEAIHQDVFGKLGFTFVPGRTPISIGWNLGINIFSRQKETALTFFKWLYQKDVNYYLTILGGQSTSVYPYENNELLKLYPWMRITMDNFKYARKRVTSHKKNSIIIPWNRIEDIIYAGTKRMFAGQDIADCLENINSGVTDLMTVYGHFRGNN